MAGKIDNRGGGTDGKPLAEAADRALWQRSTTAETVENEGERFLDLAGAIAIASWLGFALGTDFSAYFGQTDQASEDGFLRDMLDPSTAFLRDLTPGSQT